MAMTVPLDDGKEKKMRLPEFVSDLNANSTRPA
jgi:hypothetical protein